MYEVELLEKMEMRMLRWILDVLLKEERRMRTHQLVDASCVMDRL